MPPRQLRSPEGEETSDEFVEAELEMLAMGAKNIPQGTALGAALPCTKFLEEVAGLVRLQSLPGTP